jgi:acetyl/propionyl-CoA carboxylase alpha subunit
MTSTVKMTRIGVGTYLVEHDGRNEIIHVAGPAADRWVFWNGQVFRGDFRPGLSPKAKAAGAAPGPHGGLVTAIIAPMPARVGSLAVATGTRVRKGDILIVLEAMKMELPLRAPADGLVTAVHCEQGQLVQADAVLMDLE